MKIILGISAFYHDAAAALIVGDEIVAAAQEERFTRIKHTSEFPVNAVKYCLEYAGFSIDELDAVVFYDKPLLKFERLLETYYAFAPLGVRQFVTSIPVWIKEKLFLKTSMFKKFFIFSIVLFVLALGFAFYTFFIGGNSVSNNNIEISVISKRKTRRVCCGI